MQSEPLLPSQSSNATATHNSVESITTKARTEIGTSLYCVGMLARAFLNVWSMFHITSFRSPTTRDWLNLTADLVLLSSLLWQVCYKPARNNSGTAKAFLIILVVLLEILTIFDIINAVRGGLDNALVWTLAILQLLTNGFFGFVCLKPNTKYCGPLFGED